MKKSIIILGAGGHARVIYEVLRLQGEKVMAISDPGFTNSHKRPNWMDGDNLLLNDDEQILKYSPQEVHLANGLGSVDVENHRQKIFNFFKLKGYSFINVIHPTAIIASNVKLGEGAQVMAGAIIQSGSILGDNDLLNTGATIDHDCRVGAHVHLAPGAVLSGGVNIGKGSHVGTGAIIIQNITIGNICTIGAGAVVVKDVPDYTRVAGVPAKHIGENR